MPVPAATPARAFFAPGSPCAKPKPPITIATRLATFAMVPVKRLWIAVKPVSNGEPCASAATGMRKNNLEDVRPALVQDWLRNLVLSPKYKGHIRSLMYRLFDKAMLWELLNVERNPMDLVEVKGISKRKKRPRVLQVKDAWQMLDALVQPFRTIVLIGLCFGLRISEILGLRWTDFDFKRSVVLIQRSAVGKRLNKLKTEYSQDEVPIERGFILELRKWQALCLDTEEHWLFPSPVTGRPYHADSMRNDYLVPTGLKLGLGRIGFHTFRHTYRAWLDETGAPVGVQQKLMRHAHVSTTMDQYGNASALAKRKANRPIVQRLLQRPANQEVSIQ